MGLKEREVGSDRDEGRGMRDSKRKTEEVFAVCCGVFSVRSC